MWPIIDQVNESEGFTGRGGGLLGGGDLGVVCPRRFQPITVPRTTLQNLITQERGTHLFRKVEKWPRPATPQAFLSNIYSLRRAVR